MQSVPLERVVTVLLGNLYRIMSGARRRQLLVLLGVMLLGAVAELMTIGAVLPFLALLGGSAAAMMRYAGAIGVSLDPQRLVLLAGAFVIVGALAAAALRLLLLWVTQRFIMALGHDIASVIFARALRRPYADHVRGHSSELLAGMDKVRDVVSGILQPGIQGATALVIAACIAVLLIVISPLASIVAALSLIAVYTAVTFATQRRLRANSQALATSATARTKIIQESLGAIRDIILDRSQSMLEARFDGIDRRLREAMSSNTFMAGAPRFVVEAAGIVIITVVALAMSAQAGGLLNALPVLGALALGAQRLLPLLHQAYNGWSLGMGNMQALHDVIDLLDVPVAPVGDAAAAGSVTFGRDIVFDAVSFGYTPEALTLSDVRLTIARGARIGVIGVTGSGKSTLLDLIMGLLQPSSGTILIDGVALDDATRSAWQGRIAHVPQAIYLVDDSIAANIAFGIEPDRIDAERLRAVTEAACLAEFIDSLADGFATQVGERGIRLSGGQRQRIGIARALYKRAELLILDEATSALDDETEGRVIDRIMQADAGMTVIMIAHRRSTLAGCDRIVRVGDGRVADETA